MTAGFEPPAETPQDQSPFEEDPKESPNIWDEDFLRVTITTDAMKIVNEIPGVEFESFDDWMNHVDKVVEKIKAS
jgi:hypothetical protein